MKHRIIAFCFLAIVVPVIILCVYRAWTVAEVYPFKRLLLGNSLHFSSVIGYVPETFDEKLVAVNGKAVSAGDDILSIVTDQSAYSVTYHADTSVRKRSLDQKAFNNDIFAFIFLILLCGSIHLVLSCVLWCIFPLNREIRFFSIFEAVLSLYLISIVLYLLYARTSALLACSSFLVAMTMLHISSAFVLPAEKKYWRPVLFGAAISGMLVSALIWAGGSTPMFHAANGFFIIFTFLIFSVIAGSRLKGDRMIGRVPAAVVSFLILGCAVFPFAMISLSLVIKIDLPISFFAVLTIFIPMIIGVNIASGNLRGIFFFKRRNIIRLLLDIFISLVFVSALYCILVSGISSRGFLLLQAAAVAGFIVLLGVRRRVVAALRLYHLPQHENFSAALRKISEVTASPSPIRLKVDEIFTTLSTITDARLLRIELFEDVLIRRIEPIQGRIEYSRNEKLWRYFSRAPGAVYRHSLFWAPKFLEFARENEPWCDLLIPVMEDGFVIGVLKVSAKNNNEAFTDDEIRFLQAASTLLYHLIENEILHLDYKEKRNYEKEIDVASYVQMRLFPRFVPSGKGFTCGYLSRPYIKVTGDYFDFVSLDEDRTLFAVGDVAGHGLSAATLLAVTDHIIAACVSEQRELGEIFSELNNFFTSRYRGTEIMTLFMMVFDRRNRRAQYINAGHCLPMLIRSGEVVLNRFPDRSLLLGAESKAVYHPSLVGFLPGDEVILYTDGIVEIQKDLQGDNNGDVFLIDVLTGTAELSIEEKIEILGREIEQFPKNSIMDDITVLGMRID
jgi:sigma-B regulation protein RsbU (phosphoserine phosphatase)